MAKLLGILLTFLGVNLFLVLIAGAIFMYTKMKTDFFKRNWGLFLGALISLLVIFFGIILLFKGREPEIYLPEASINWSKQNEAILYSKDIWEEIQYSLNGNAKGECYFEIKENGRNVFIFKPWVPNPDLQKDSDLFSCIQKVSQRLIKEKIWSLLLLVKNFCERGNHGILVIEKEEGGYKIYLVNVVEKKYVITNVEWIFGKEKSKISSDRECKKYFRGSDDDILRAIVDYCKKGGKIESSTILKQICER